jgi:uncharacterized membrane protein
MKKPENKTRPKIIKSSSKNSEVLDEKKSNKESEDSQISTEIVQIENELIEINPKIFSGVPEAKKNELLRTFTKVSIIQKSHSGPLPDPETLAHYNSIITDGANRIMVMAEKQQDHRIKLETKAIGSQLFQSQLGQIFGFVISIIVISAGVYLGVNGHETMGSILVSATLVSLASIFALGKIYKNKASKD